MPNIKKIFPNPQAQDLQIAGIYQDIEPDLLKLIQTGQLKPKPLMVCSGGTSSSCAAEGHWTLDLKENFQGINFDHQKKELLIQAGVSMKKLIEEVTTFGRSFPIGVSSMTGVGYILTGGISPLSRRYGLAIDQILEISGFWGNGNEFHLSKPNSSINNNIKEWKALLGAAPFIAIVTSLKLKTYQLKPLVLWETSLTPMQLLKTIELAEKWPRSISLHWVWGDRIKAYGVYEVDLINGSDEFEELLIKLPKSNDFSRYTVSNMNELKNFKLPIEKTSDSPKEYSEVLGLLGPSLKNKAKDVIEVIKKLMDNRPNKSSYIAAQQLGGKTFANQDNISSFIYRDSMWKPWITGAWDAEDPIGREKSLQWIEESWEKLEDFFPGVHLAQIHPHLSWHKKEINLAFKNWLPELQQLKSKYDPKGNLPPL
ncbi:MULTISPECIES: FAD-binding protein [unclassified Prochlorococcus]|uniref:FAD-binding protein n=1 Tax=unclassified Prochlorococcus TaxID=2627481 RepID=UPI0005337335|nr:MULTISPECIES: FAD-binding protein [unclassified Prochlorococcus]KGG15120.1 FAD linked oxidase [Prochlorococcus sp. MIT 0602]KGG17392.1 FAD linked oxidase [Prochlorococcus sp. MIT 0603]